MSTSHYETQKLQKVPTLTAYFFSNIIMEKLGEVFKVDCDAVLSDFDKAVGHSVLTMVENHTSKGGFLWRYGYHNDEFMDKM